MSELKQYANKIELGVGLHMFGNRLSISAVPKRIELEVTATGVLCRHLEQRRTVFIPYANIKGMEVPFYDLNGLEVEQPKVKSLPIRNQNGK